MSNHTSLPIGRLAAEFAVIVVGVLVALLAESAWQERGERAREQVILEDLLDEFRENERRLLRDIDLSQASRESAVAWAAVMKGGVQVSSDSVATLWAGALNWGRFDPVTGALRSVVDGGELSLIRNDELRLAVAGWSDRAEEARITAREVLIVMSDQAPFALEIQPGAPLTPGQASAIGIMEDYGGGSLLQLRPLLERLRETIGLLEAELSE
jgi:hypothetical protein